MNLKVFGGIAAVACASLLAGTASAQYETIAWRSVQAPGAGGAFFLRLRPPTIAGSCEVGAP